MDPFFALWKVDVDKTKKLDVILLKRTSCEAVDWSGGWATPWGSASQMRPCSAADVFCAKA